MSYNNQGEAASYYASAGQHQQHQQHQQQSYGNQQSSYNNQQQQRYGNGQQDGPTGERGVLGAIGGAVAGGVGGNAIGNKTGHSKTSTIIGAIAGAVAGHKIQDGVSDWKDKRDEEKEEAKRKEEEEKRREEEERRRKEEDEKRKKEEQNRPQQQNHHQTQHQQPQQSRDSGVRYAGGFSGSSKDICLDASGDYNLRAQCKGRDGNHRSSSISLNQIITNDRGCFKWVAAKSSSGSCGGNKPASYVVVAGDTLRDIGSKVGVSWEELARHNCLQNPDLIFPGQEIKIPGGGGSSNNSNNNNAGAGNFGASARNVRLEDCGKKLVGELRRDGQWVRAELILDEKIGNDNGSLVYKA